MTDIRLGTSDDMWSQYGFEDSPLYVNGKDTERRILTKGDEFVSVVGKNYRILPNEVAVDIAEKSAQLCGLVPFSEFSGDWFVKMNDHVIENGWKVHALYALNKPYEVDGDKMHLGVGIHNSIDGSMGFGAGIFTFRHACANMVFAGMKGYEQSFDQRRTLEYIYSRHTSSLTIAMELLQEKIVNLMEKAQVIVDAYNQMAKNKLTEELIKKIRASRISDKVLPDYLKAEELQLTDLTEWNAYNDITALIWHNKKGNMDTKMTYFDQLHRVMPLVRSV